MVRLSSTNTATSSRNGGKAEVEAGGEVEMVPPDGGWGWVIVFANCIISGMTNSLLSGFSIVYVYLVAAGYTNAQVVVIPAVYVGITNIFGPLSTGLSHYYPARRLVATGTIITALAIFLLAFYGSLVWFYFCFGILAGIGNALAMHQGILLSQQYFRKRRVMAHGISTVGGSLAFMVFPPFVAYLVQVYSTEGTFLVWSAIILNGMVGAALCHPVSWHLKPARIDSVNQSEDRKQDNNLQEEDVSLSKMSPGKEHEKMIHDIPESDRDSDDGTKAPEGIENSVGRVPTTIRETDPEMYHETKKAMPMEQMKHLMVSDESIYRLGKHPGHKSDCKDRIRTLTSAYEEFGSALSIEIQIRNENFEIPSDMSESREEVDGPCIICGLKLPRLSHLVKLSLLKHPAFLITTIGSIANRLVYSSAITYMPSMGHEVGVGVRAPYLLTVLAVGELASKFIISSVSDQGWLQRRYIYILGCVTAGLTNTLITFTWNFATLGLACGVLGFSYGTIISVGPILLVEYLGVKLLPCSYGLLLFANGLSGVILMPVTGWLADIFGNYTTTFYVLGSLNMVPAVLWLIIPFFHTPEENTEKAHSRNH